MDVEFSNVSLILLLLYMLCVCLLWRFVNRLKFFTRSLLLALFIPMIIHTISSTSKKMFERKRKLTYVNNFHRMGHLLVVKRGIDT